MSLPRCHHSHTAPCLRIAGRLSDWSHELVGSVSTLSVDPTTKISLVKRTRGLYSTKNRKNRANGSGEIPTIGTNKENRSSPVMVILRGGMGGREPQEPSAGVACLHTGSERLDGNSRPNDTPHPVTLPVQE